MKEFLLFPFRGKVAIENYSVFKKIAKTILGYFKMMFLLFLLMVGVVLIFDFEGENIPKKVINRMEGIPFYGRIFLMCLFLPFLEELAFRLFLKPKKRNLIIGISVFCFYSSLFVLGLIGLKDNSGYFGVLCMLLAGLSARYYFEKLKVFFEKYKLFIINILAFTFAIFHYDTYGFFDNPKFAVALMSGVLFIAYYASFVRLKFGFAYAVLVHCLHNTLVLLPIIIKGLS